MSLKYRAAFVLLALVGASSCLASDAAVQIDRPGVHAVMVHPAEARSRVPGILVLGGAEGGNKWAAEVARGLAEHGYAALAVAYFNSPGLDEQLRQIPLERLSRGIDELARDRRVDPRRIAVLGLSKGAEAALLLATSDRRIKAVVLGSPTDVVWQGIDRKSATVVSSWTVGGRPLPFVPFVACDQCSLGGLYTRSREAPTSTAAAAIPAERVRGPILMLASSNDGVWPSETMARSLETRLRENRFRHRVVVLSYPDGGHFTLGPLAAEEARSDAGFGGGTPEGVVAARRDSWPKVLGFLDATFDYKPRRPGDQSLSRRRGS